MGACQKYVIIANVNIKWHRNSNMGSCPKNIKNIKYGGFVTNVY